MMEVVIGVGVHFFSEGDGMRVERTLWTELSEMK